MTRHQFSRLLLLSTLVALYSPVIGAQSSGYQNNAGIPSFGTYINSEIDTVDLVHGGLKIQIPVVTRKGRDFEIATTLRNDSKMWVAIAYDFDYGDPPNQYERFYWSPFGDPEPQEVDSVNSGYIDHNEQLYTCSQSFPPDPAPQLMIYSNWRFIEPDGTAHNFPTRKVQRVAVPGYPGDLCYDDISYTPQLLTAPSDTGGMKIDISAYDGYGAGARIVKAWFKDGTVWNSQGGLSLTDTNGNQCCTYQNNWELDSLGRPVKQSRGGSNPWTDPTYIDFYDSSGQVRTVQLQPASHNAATAFPSTGPAYPENCGFDQYNGPLLGWQSITLPNGLAYTFSYDDPNNPGHPNPFGEITKITLPTGGYIKYKWATLPQWDIGPVTGYCAGTPLDSRVLIERRVSPDGVTEQVWTYAYSSGGPGLTTVTDPMGNIQVHSFTNLGPNWWSNVFVENQVEYRNSSGTPLRRVTTDWATDTGPSIAFQTSDTNDYPVEPTGFYLGNSQPRNPRIIRVTTALLDTNQVSKVETDYTDCLSWTAYNNQNFTDCPGNPTQIREYDYGTGSAGPLLRYTNLTYLHGSSGPYFDAHMMDRVTGKYVYTGSGTLAAQTTYGYDTTTVAGTSGVPYHDYGNYSSGNTLRGNRTTISHWLNITGSSLTATNYYNDVGNLVTTSDPLGNSTQFSYADNFSDGTNRNSQAYVTSITYPTINGIAHVDGKQYSWYTGLAAASCGLNYPNPSGCSSSQNPSQSSPVPDYTKYTYDLFDRPVTVTQSDGGTTGFTFNETSLPLSAVSVSSTDSSHTLTTTASMDGLGRIIQTQLNSDPDGVDYTDITYDSLGRKSTVSNPHRSSAASTYGITMTNYDALGRVVRVIPPDGSSSANNVTTNYSGNCTTVTDQAGKSSKSCSDSLGRVIQFFEDLSSSNYETDYTYDVLDNLVQVVQKGGTADNTKWRTRTFSYDSLSHLLCSSNPENSSAPCPVTATSTYTTGTTGYAYDANGNVSAKTALAPNQTGIATVITSYSYDALNRLTQKSYSDNGITPTIRYGYDGVGLTGCATTPPTLVDTYPKGLRTSMCDGAGAESWSHDFMGRILTDSRTTNTISKSTSYTYLPYVNGSINSITYPSGRTLTYTYNTAAQATSASDVANSITYTSNAHYFPPGELAFLQKGSAGINSTYIFNKRLQPCWMYSTTGTPAISWNTAQCTDTAAAASILDYKYDFSLGAADNGNVASITNNINPARSQFFTYDALNRLLTANTAAKTGQYAWGLSFGYDAWANLLTATVTRGSANGLNVGTTPSNQIPGYCYDAAGNLLDQGTCQNPHAYVYNAENQITSAAGVTYRYDGNGNRVQKSSGILHWYGAGSDPFDETDWNGNLTDEYIFFGGSRIARRDASNNVDYYFADHLGTTHVVTNASGTILDDSDFYPFGGERPYLSSSGNTYKFTGKERDSESGLDNFSARYDSSTLGRFMSSDPVAITAGRLYDPQQFNAYAYVRDNPLRFVDPTGMMVQISGDIEEGRGFLCSMVGGACDNLSVDSKNGFVKFTPTDGELEDPRVKLLYDYVQDTSIHYLYFNPDHSKEGDVKAPPAGPPKAPPPPGKGPNGEPNEWVLDEQFNDKQYAPVYRPRYPVASPKGSQPKLQWDPFDNQWTRVPGDGGNIEHYGVWGERRFKMEYHPSLMDRLKKIPPQRIVALGNAAIITYIIVSEGSRLYPPRNLVPIP